MCVSQMQEEQVIEKFSLFTATQSVGIYRRIGIKMAINDSHVLPLCIHKYYDMYKLCSVSENSMCINQAFI